MRCIVMARYPLTATSSPDAATISAAVTGRPRGLYPRAQAARFTGPRTHRPVPGAGHNLPRKPPEAFAEAVLDLASL